MATLHAYILRELLKVFALAAISLTIVFTLGGGLYNSVRNPGVTPAEIVRFMPLMIPIVAVFTMPLAALFAVTMVYGRLAADNELTACRASGVNVHRLFLGAGLLAFLISACCFLLANYVGPDFLRAIEHYGRTNLRDIAAERLKQKGMVRYVADKGQKTFLTARGVLSYTRQQLEAHGYDPQLDYLFIDSPTCLELDHNDRVLRYTTAALGMCEFDTRRTPIQVRVVVSDGWQLSGAGSAARIARQVIGPLSFPLPMPLKASMVDLNRLLLWQREPWQAPEIAVKLQEFRDKLTIARFYAAARDALAAGRALVLRDAEGRPYHIRAATAVAEPNSRPRLRDALITVSTAGADRPTRYEAPEAEIKVHPQADGRFLVEVYLRRTPERPVREFNPRSGDYDTPRLLDTLSVDGALIPEPDVAAVASIPAATVLDPAAPLPVVGELADGRASLQREATRLRGKTTAVIHFRLAWSVSTLVTAMMGAILGVLFRGSQALAAFGLSCVPFLTIFGLITMGTRLIQNDETEVAGPLVIWLGMLGFAVANWIVLRIGVRR